MFIVIAAFSIDELENDLGAVFLVLVTSFLSDYSSILGQISS